MFMEGKTGPLSSSISQKEKKAIVCKPKRSHRDVNRSQGAEKKGGFYGRVRQLRGEVIRTGFKRLVRSVGQRVAVGKPGSRASIIKPQQGERTSPTLLEHQVQGREWRAFRLERWA